MVLANWAGNLQYRAAERVAPRSSDELRDVIRRSESIKALGTRHSFSDVADTTGTHVSLEHFDQIEEPHDNQVTVGAGMRYGELCRFLHARGLAVHNLASLPHISVAGAVATATHGSGDGNGNLATAVRAVEMVTGDGTVHTIARGDPDFDGVVVSLGALGVVTKLTLDVVPAFAVEQRVSLDLPLTALDDHFAAIFSSAYSASLFTDWRGPRINQVWMKRRTSDPESFDLTRLGTTPATSDVHPIATMSAENCTKQVGVPGPWHERLPHFRLEFTPSAGEELQSEYFVPRERAVEAIRAIDSIGREIAPRLLISEIRSIAADELWLSPHYRRASVGIHFTWKKDWANVGRLLPVIEKKLAPFDPRPHWGKLFAMRSKQIQPKYERLNDFRRLLDEFDPQRKFRNAFLDERIFS